MQIRAEAVGVARTGIGFDAANGEMTCIVTIPSAAAGNAV